MNGNNRLKSFLSCLGLLLLASTQSHAQCELLKSEMESLIRYATEVSQLTDSLQTVTESAAFGDQFQKARADARTAKHLMGNAFTSAEEAALRASDAQYYSEICGLSKVKSHAIDAESHAVDARDFAHEAFVNAQKANRAKNLGDLRYYMRKSQNASLAARKSAYFATYHAADARQNCTHNDGLSATGY